MILDKLIKDPAQRLRMAREHEGYATARDFVKKHNLSYSTYSAHEGGRNKIPEKAAKQYSELLNIPFSWLYQSYPNDHSTVDITSDYLVELEKTILTQTLESVLKTLSKYDQQINYVKLVDKCYMISQEIINKNLSQNDIPIKIAAIVGLSSDNLKKQILNPETTNN